MGGEEVEKSSILTLLCSLLFLHGNPMIRLSYLLLLIAGIATSLPAVQRPNIVLVFVDDMGWGDFSCFGNTEANTPHIDAMAEEGLRFQWFALEFGLNPWKGEIYWPGIGTLHLWS